MVGDFIAILRIQGWGWSAQSEVSLARELKIKKTENEMKQQYIGETKKMMITKKVFDADLAEWVNITIETKTVLDWCQSLQKYVFIPQD